MCIVQLMNENPKDCQHFFSTFRYEELLDYLWKLDRYVRKSVRCLKKIKKQKDLSSVLSKPFNIMSEYLHLKENFDDHQKTRQEHLEQSIHYLDELEDIDELREYYGFLRER